MKLSQEEIDAALRGLPDWSREGEAITREVVFPEFADAIAFVTRLAFAAEAIPKSLTITDQEKLCTRLSRSQLHKL